MAERLAPDAIAARTNLSGALANIQDDPDSPDALWWTADSDSSDTDARVRFPTPAAPLLVGAGLQSFRVQVRSTGGGQDPTVRVEIWESGTMLAAGANIPVTSQVSQIVALTWDASLLSDPTGADVECRVFGNSDGIVILDPFDTVEIGAIEWNADLTTVGAASYVSSNGPASRSVATSSVTPSYLASAGSSSTYVGAAEIVPGSHVSSAGSSSTYVGAAEIVPGSHVSSAGSSSTYVGSPDFCSGSGERLPPDTILEQTNLVGTIDQIQDDPDAPDGQWWVTPTAGLLLPTSARLGFGTPTPSSFCEFAGIPQEFRALVRSTALSTPPPAGLVDPTVRLELWENGGGIPDPNFYSDLILSDGPEAYWRLGEANGSLVVADLTGNGHDAGIVGSPTLGVPGALADDPNTALETNSGNYVAPAGPAFQLPVFTIEAWGFLPSPFTPLTTPPDVVAGELDPVGTKIQVTDVGGQHFWQFLFAFAVNVLVPVTLGQYQHLVMVVDSTTLTVTVYVDGVLVASVPSPVATGLFDSFHLGSATSGIVLRQDEIAFYPYALSPQQVIAHHDAGIAPGSSHLISSPEFAVTSGTGEVVSWFWDASLLSDPTGAGVECRVVGTPAIMDEVGWTVEVGALEWNAASCAGCRYADSQGSSGQGYVAGVPDFSATYDNASSGADSAWVAAFGPDAAAYLASLGSNARSGPGFGPGGRDYFSSVGSGASWSDVVGPPCVEVDGDSNPIPIEPCPDVTGGSTPIPPAETCAEVTSDSALMIVCEVSPP